MNICHSGLPLPWSPTYLSLEAATYSPSCQTQRTPIEPPRHGRDHNKRQETPSQLVGAVTTVYLRRGPIECSDPKLETISPRKSGNKAIIKKLNAKRPARKTRKGEPSVEISICDSPARYRLPERESHPSGERESRAVNSQLPLVNNKEMSLAVSAARQLVLLRDMPMSGIKEKKAEQTMGQFQSTIKRLVVAESAVRAGPELPGLRPLESTRHAWRSPAGPSCVPRDPPR